MKLDLAASEPEDEEEEDEDDGIGEMTKIDLGKEGAKGADGNEVVFKVEFEKDDENGNDDENEIDYL